MAAVLKTAVGLNPPRVRISRPPHRIDTRRLLTSTFTGQGPSRVTRLHPALSGHLRLSVAKQWLSSERGVDSLAGAVLLAGDALGVHAQQHGHAVSCPFGHLGRRYPGIQPERNAGVPEVVRPAGSGEATSAIVMAATRAFRQVPP
jgi:hypothetical protein